MNIPSSISPFSVVALSNALSQHARVGLQERQDVQFAAEQLPQKPMTFVEQVENYKRQVFLLKRQIRCERAYRRDGMASRHEAADETRPLGTKKKDSQAAQKTVKQNLRDLRRKTSLWVRLAAIWPF